MKVVNAERLRAASAGFRALFYEDLAARTVIWPQLAMRIDSDSPEETYNWLTGFGQMREWVGDRVIRSLAAHGFTIRKKDWEYTISVHRDEILFDKLNLVRPRIQNMADLAARHRDQLVADLLIGGFTNLCYDGQYFFDTDHPSPGTASGVQSNRTNKKLSKQAFEAAYAAMQALVNDEGEPLEITPTHLVVPPQLRATALEIVKAERLENGQTNINRDAVEVLVLPRLAKQPTYWFLLDLSRPIKPFIVQIVKDMEFVGLESPDDQNVFMRKEYLYGVDCMDNAGYALWQLAYGSTGEAD